MLFLQVSNCNGLRDIDCKYRKSSRLAKDFKMPSYSQLSRLNKNKSVDIFSYIFEELLGKAEKEIKSPINMKNFHDIKIIDSSMICIGKGLAPNLYYQEKDSAVRISTLLSYGTKLPTKITIVPAKIGERTCIDNYVSDKKSIYLFDKGYSKYSWYDEMTTKQIRFITRQHSNTGTEEYIKVQIPE